MNYLIKTTSRARFSTWAAVKSWFFAAERCTLWQLATINFWPSIEFGWNSPKCYFSCKIEFWILCAKIQILPQCDSLLLLRVVWFSADTFQLLTKESKERKKKKLAWGRAEAWETASTACKFRKSRSELRRGSYISTLWDVLSITTDILFKSSSSKTTMGIVDLTTNLQS